MGWSSQVAREAHNLEVVGSNPTPTTFSGSRAGVGLVVSGRLISDQLGFNSRLRHHMKPIKEDSRVRKVEDTQDASIEEILYSLHWNDNLTHREIGEKLGLPRSTVTRWFKCLDVPSQSENRMTRKRLEQHKEWKKKREEKERQKQERQRKMEVELERRFDRKFFDSWTPEMAYVLGLLFADGYVYRNPRGSNYFCFCSADKELVERVKQLLRSKHRIGKKDRSENERWKPLYVLQIGSKEVVEALAGYGVVQNKSNIIEFPGVPQGCLSHFIRGYFDGDGGVWYGKTYRKRRQKTVKILMAHFTSGSYHFLQRLHEVLKEHSKIRGGHIETKQRGYQLAFSQNDSRALFYFIYQGGGENLCLKRKYGRFSGAIEHIS